MHKLKLYLDTTILNFVFADDAPKDKEDTLRFFKQIDRFEVSISEVVLREISLSQPQKREQLTSLWRRHDLNVLEFDTEAQELSEKYIRSGIIPVKYRDDASHIAIATVNNFDAILSWNFQHIVKMKTKREVVAINLIAGYKPIDIYTPGEVIENV